MEELCPPLRHASPHLYKRSLCCFLTAVCGDTRMRLFFERHKTVLAVAMRSRRIRRTEIRHNWHTRRRRKFRIPEPTTQFLWRNIIGTLRDIYGPMSAQIKMWSNTSSFLLVHHHILKNSILQKITTWVVYIHVIPCTGSIANTICY